MVRNGASFDGICEQPHRPAGAIRGVGRDPAQRDLQKQPQKWLCFTRWKRNERKRFSTEAKRFSKRFSTDQRILNRSRKAVLCVMTRNSSQYTRLIQTTPGWHVDVGAPGGSAPGALW